MVLHGSVDGFTRTIIYLQCLSNNRASSVLSLFLGGVHNFGLPSRVRCDHGMENIHVARFMLERRGMKSVITGILSGSWSNECVSETSLKQLTSADTE